MDDGAKDGAVIAKAILEGGVLRTEILSTSTYSVGWGRSAYVTLEDLCHAGH